MMHHVLFLLSTKYLWILQHSYDKIGIYCNNVNVTPTNHNPGR